MDSGFAISIYLDSTIIATSHKLETPSSQSCNPSPGFFSVIPSPAVFSLSAVTLFFTGPSRRQTLTSLVLYCTALPGRRILTVVVDECSLVAPPLLSGPQSTRNPLKAILHVPSREHVVEQLSFPVVTQTSLVLAITEVHRFADSNGRWLSRNVSQFVT
jgi:hypothetical protein